MSDRYADAKAQYSEIGINTDTALKQLAEFSLSLLCWQANDGFTLASKDRKNRDFWIAHVERARGNIRLYGTFAGQSCGI